MGFAAAFAAGAEFLNQRSGKRAARRNRKARRLQARKFDPFIEFGKEGFAGARDVGSSLLNILSDPSQITQHPEFQFLRSEGLRGAGQLLQAGGKRLSGQGLRTGARFSEGLASTFLSEMINRRRGVFF